MSLQSFHQIFRTFERRQASVISTAVLTVATFWLIRQIVGGSKKPNRSELQKIPTPEGEYIFLGHLPLIGDQPGLTVTKWHKQLGPIVRVKMGVQDWVFIGDREMAYDIFALNGTKSSGRPLSTFNYHIHSKGDRGLAFIDNNKYWKISRAGFVSFFSTKAVDNIYHIIEKHTQESINLMIKDYKKTPEAGIDPINYSQISAMNLIFSTVFGVPGVLSVNEKLFKDIVSTVKGHVQWMSVLGDLSAYFPSLSFLDFLSQKKKRMLNFVKNEQHPVYIDLVNKALKSKEPNLIKKLKETGMPYNIREEHLVATGIELMIGGVDTTSSSVAFAIGLLCHYKNWQNKMIEEIDAYIESHGHAPVYADRASLPNVLAVMKETMRYRPSGSLGLAHRATEDILYKDYIIPKDTLLITNINTFNTSSSYFEEPEKFKPERYLGDIQSLHATSNGPVAKRELYNFGWGRRMCPGIYLAENEVFCWLCLLLSNYTIEPVVSPNGEKDYPNIEDCLDFGTIVVPVPFKVKYEPRHNKAVLS
ncbi:cytochrome P450 [Sporodiniella umbellata]|nr:cytochrome P450 [Sporodiniella umbellata]